MTAVTFTILAFGRRLERRLTPDQVVEATLMLVECREMIRPNGFAILLQGDDNVIHIAHREPASAR